MHSLFTSDKYTILQLSMYYLGASAWLITYMLVIRKILKEKFVEFPAIVICANVAWELLWGFAFKLDFGGPILLWAWRAGFIMDAFMLFATLKYGSSQTTIPFIKKKFKTIMSTAFLCFGVIIYFYVKEGYDLPMGFNSGMILNLLMSALCIILVLRLHDRKFSRAIAWGKFLASSVFLNAYIWLIPGPFNMSRVLCVICFFLDIYYIYLVYTRVKELKKAPY